MKPMRLIVALSVLMAFTLTACEFDFALGDLGLTDENAPEAQEPDVKTSLNAAEALKNLRVRNPRKLYRQGELDNVCQGVELMRDEARVRSIASLKSLETLRQYRSALDDKYEDARQKAYLDAVVDLAAIAAGWPLGEGLANKIYGEFTQTISENILKGGFKSANQRMLKDALLTGVTGQATGGLPEHVTTLAPTEGFGSDVAWEAVKQGMDSKLGKVAAESTFLVFDSVKLAASVYEGKSTLEALRGLISTTDQRISLLTAKHATEVEGWQRMTSNFDRCEHERKLGFHPFEDEGFLKEQVELEGTYLPSDLVAYPPAQTPN